MERAHRTRRKFRSDVAEKKTEERPARDVEERVDNQRRQEEPAR